MCVQSCVCSACPRPSWGPPVARGSAVVAVGGVCPPPLPFGFFFRLCGVGCWLSQVGSHGLCPPIPSLLGRVVWCSYVSFFCVVCFSVFWVSLPSVGRCPRLGVAGFGWVVPRRPFGGSCLQCRLDGGFGRLLWCWWAAWWLWAILATPPPLLVFFGGVVWLFLPLLSLGWRTHWSAFHVAFRFAVGHCVLQGRAPAPCVGWVMYTLSSAPLPAGLGSGSAGWAVVPGGLVWPWVSRVTSSLRCGF